MLKTCTLCKKEKDLCNFSKNVNSPDGFMCRCKECEKDRKKWYYSEQYCDVMKSKRETQKDALNKYSKDYHSKNKHTIHQRNKVWRSKNKESIRSRIRRYYKTSEKFRMSVILRSRIRSALKRFHTTKKARTFELIGCGLKELKSHLCSLMKDGMTWDKLMSGEIHVEHKIPCALFDLTKKSHQLACFHFSNLQPMFGHDNLVKNKYTDEKIDIEKYVQDFLDKYKIILQ